MGCGPAEERVLLTGLHAVADIYCENCKTTLGWKYVRDHLQIHFPLVCFELLFRSALVFLHDSAVLLDSRRTNHVLQQVKTVRFLLLNIFWLDLGVQSDFWSPSIYDNYSARPLAARNQSATSEALQ